MIVSIILALRLVNAATDYQLSLDSFLQNPTISSMSQAMETQTNKNVAQSLSSEINHMIETFVMGLPSSLAAPQDSQASSPTSTINASVASAKTDSPKETSTGKPSLPATTLAPQKGTPLVFTDSTGPAANLPSHTETLGQISSRALVDTPLYVSSAAIKTTLGDPVVAPAATQTTLDDPLVAPAATQTTLDGPVVAPVTTQTTLGDPVVAPAVTQTTLGDPAIAPTGTQTMIGEPAVAPAATQSHAVAPAVASVVTQTTLDDPVVAPAGTQTMVGDPAVAPGVTNTKLGEPAVAPAGIQTVVGNGAIAPAVTKTKIGNGAFVPIVTRTKVVDPVVAPAVTQTIIGNPAMAPAVTHTLLGDPAYVSHVVTRSILGDPVYVTPTVTQTIMGPPVYVTANAGPVVVTETAFNIVTEYSTVVVHKTVTVQADASPIASSIETEGAPDSSPTTPSKEIDEDAFSVSSSVEINAPPISAPTAPSMDLDAPTDSSPTTLEINSPPNSSPTAVEINAAPVLNEDGFLDLDPETGSETSYIDSYFDRRKRSLKDLEILQARPDLLSGSDSSLKEGTHSYSPITSFDADSLPAPSEETSVLKTDLSNSYQKVNKSSTPSPNSDVEPPILVSEPVQSSTQSVRAVETAPQIVPAITASMNHLLNNTNSQPKSTLETLPVQEAPTIMSNLAPITPSFQPEGLTAILAMMVFTLL